MANSWAGGLLEGLQAGQRAAGEWQARRIQAEQADQARQLFQMNLARLRREQADVEALPEDLTTLYRSMGSGAAPGVGASEFFNPEMSLADLRATAQDVPVPQTMADLAQRMDPAKLARIERLMPSALGQLKLQSPWEAAKARRSEQGQQELATLLDTMETPKTQQEAFGVLRRINALGVKYNLPITQDVSKLLVTNMMKNPGGESTKTFINSMLTGYRASQAAGRSASEAMTEGLVSALEGSQELWSDPELLKSTMEIWTKLKPAAPEKPQLGPVLSPGQAYKDAKGEWVQSPVPKLITNKQGSWTWNATTNEYERVEGTGPSEAKEKPPTNPESMAWLMAQSNGFKPGTPEHAAEAERIWKRIKDAQHQSGAAPPRTYETVFAQGALEIAERQWPNDPQKRMAFIARAREVLDSKESLANNATQVQADLEKLVDELNGKAPAPMPARENTSVFAAIGSWVKNVLGAKTPNAVATPQSVPEATAPAAPGTPLSVTPLRPPPSAADAQAAQQALAQPGVPPIREAVEERTPPRPESPEESSAGLPSGMVATPTLPLERFKGNAVKVLVWPQPDGTVRLVPQVEPSTGEALTDAQAQARFARTGEHLGIFKSEADVTRYLQVAQARPPTALPPRPSPLQTRGRPGKINVTLPPEGVPTRDQALAEATRLRQAYPEATDDEIVGAMRDGGWKVK